MISFPLGVMAAQNTLDVLVHVRVVKREPKIIYEKSQNKSDIGRWVTVKWTDVGRTDAVLVEVEKNVGMVFEPHGNLQRIALDQIIEKRDYLNAQ